MQVITDASGKKTLRVDFAAFDAHALDAHALDAPVDFAALGEGVEAAILGAGELRYDVRRLEPPAVLERHKMGVAVRKATATTANLQSVRMNKPRECCQLCVPPAAAGVLLIKRIDIEMFLDAMIYGHYQNSQVRWVDLDKRPDKKRNTLMRCLTAEWYGPAAPPITDIEVVNWWSPIEIYDPIAATHTEVSVKSSATFHMAESRATVNPTAQTPDSRGRA